MHDGHANKYSLTNDGVHHKLKLLIKEGEKVCSSARVCLVDGRKFLDGMKHQHINDRRFWTGLGLKRL